MVENVARLTPNARKTPFIEVSDLEKRYDTRNGPINAIEKVSFNVSKGEFISIVGPSGCGKSTLMKMIGKLLQPTSGSINFHGLPAGASSPDLGMVFQDAVLLPWRTVFQNVCLPIEVMGLERSKYEQRARDLIELVGLKGFENKYPTELSGGMQQRTSIARALVSDPPLLLMDEPFGALDALTRETMNQELQRIWMESKKTVLFITHSIPESVLLSDRVVVMSARPSRVQEIIDIDLPRPRKLTDTTTADFGKYVAHIRSLLSATTEL